MKLLFKLFGFAALAIMSLNCSTVQFQNLNNQQNELLIWSADHKLTEADFLGEIPGKSVGQSGNIYLNMPFQYQKYHILLPLNVQVNACMSKKISWFNKKNAVPGTLDYFQLLFDSYEVHARIMKKKIKEASFNPINPTEEITKLANEVQTSASVEISKIENETVRGTNKAELNRWRAEIDQRLLELDDFK